jgi:DNA modification methylase
VEDCCGEYAVSVKLFCGDCLEILPTLEGVDAVITDPPYNIGFDKYSQYHDVLSDSDYIALIGELGRFDTKIISQYPEETMKYIIPALGVPEHVGAWCYNGNIPRRFRLINYYGISPDYSRIKQPYKNPSDKRIKALIANGSDGTPLYEWWSDIQLVKNVSKEKTEHPCPVPEKLVERIITIATEPGWTILDPFMGSGTTGVAAVKLGRNFIGIERDPKYFDIAERRITEAQMDPLEAAP